MVKEIAHIQFYTLTILNLWGNQIKSIEVLPSTHMPLLEQLYLCTFFDEEDDNMITSVRVMRKAIWPALQTLDLSTRRII